MRVQTGLYIALLTVAQFPPLTSTRLLYMICIMCHRGLSPCHDRSSILLCPLRYSRKCQCLTCEQQPDEICCVSKNDTGVAQYNFNACQPILVIFGRDVAERMLSNGDLLSQLS